MGGNISTLMDDINKPNHELYNMVKWQNEMIDVENAKLRDNYSVDKQRVLNMTNNIQGWNQLNFILWWIYYIIVFVIFFIFFRNDTIPLSRNQKIYVSVGLLLYPFIITTIELGLYNLSIFISSLVQGYPYPKDGDSQPTFSFLNGLPSVYY